MTYHVLYRGPLSSCNYGCDYCPFAKRDENYAQLATDRTALERFLGWIERQQHRRFGVLFTPWGEALVRRWYQEALVRLTNMPHVETAAIQTNLSANFDWIDRCRLDRLALWATYHPSEVPRARFLDRVHRLHASGVQMSVGVVGLREHADEIEQLRAELPPEVYLWINAYKRVKSYYDDDVRSRLTAIDPLFPLNNQRHASRDQPCWAGETSFTVDGAGDIRRCHFVSKPIGNIDDPDWESAMQPRRCPNETCGCYIGYINLKRLNLDLTYGESILQRIPTAYHEAAKAVSPEGSHAAASETSQRATGSADRAIEAT